MRSGIKRLVRQRVVINTKDEHSIRGVLTASYRDCLVLSEPEYLQEAQPNEVAGRIVVPSENISWVQVL